jgi:class 3 adenylate cyclase
VAGYAAHIAADEEGTIRRFATLARHAEQIINGHGGRIFNTAGDAFLAEFDSAVNGVRAALDILDACVSLAHEMRPERALALRIGIAFGDVVVADDGNLLGDAVNVAARLQALAAPGTLWISRDVQSLVRNKIALTMEDLGEQHLKNIAQPVHAYVVRPDDAALPLAASGTGATSGVAAPPRPSTTGTRWPALPSMPPHRPYWRQRDRRSDPSRQDRASRGVRCFRPTTSGTRASIACPCIRSPPHSLPASAASVRCTRISAALSHRGNRSGSRSASCRPRNPW